MKVPAKPANEEKRIAALYSFDLINEIGQSAFDDIVKMAASICDTPISLITLLTEDKQIFKAKIGLDGDGTSRDVSFCGHGILTPDQPFIVQSASKDERFSDNPLVAGAPHIEFYAGIPLKTTDGYGLGSLCVIDTKPRELTEQQIEMLKMLANQVIRLFELKKTTDALEKKDQSLVSSVQQLHSFTSDVCHDLKMSLRNIELTIEVIMRTNEPNLQGPITDQLNNIIGISNEAMTYMSSMDKYTNSLGDFNAGPSMVPMGNLIKEVIQEIKSPLPLEVDVTHPMPSIYHSPIVLKHIFYNLVKDCTHSLTTKEAKIKFTYKEENRLHCFEVEDNFSNTHKLDNNVYLPFAASPQKDKILINNNVQLAVVKQLLSLTGGEISHKANETGGTTFSNQTA